MQVRPSRVQTDNLFRHLACYDAALSAVQVPDELVNADVAQLLQPDRMLLVAPDRLGVLHDVLATLRAAAAIPLRIDGIVLVEPAQPDSSTGSNADELQRLQGVPVVLSLGRGTVDDLCRDPQVAGLARWVTS